MGAIAGILSLKSEFEGNLKKTMQDMLYAMRHRGPNKYVYHENDTDIFGSRFHLQETPEQSLAIDSDKELLIIMEGEIFDVRYDLRGESLLTDAELALTLYKILGDAFLESIDGSFAFAIWHAHQKKLILARDRVGSKPLFYEKQGAYIIFGSEIKAILATQLSQKTIDLFALDNFLSYWYVPNPDTMIESIKQVRPGGMIVFEGGNVVEKQYWKFQYRQDETDKGEQHYRDKFLEVLTQSVSRRLTKFPNCGAFLSGGLDTSGVAAIMRKLKNEPFDVFTGAFIEKQYDETEDAKVVADHLGLEQFIAVVTIDKEFPDLFEKIVWYHDSPFVDTSAIPSFFASKSAKTRVDVVLTGDFPDQLIGGSGHHENLLYRQQHDPFWLKILKNKIFNYIATHMPWSAGSTHIVDRLIRMLYRETFSLEQQRIITNMPVPELVKPCLYSPELFRINRENNPLEYAKTLYSEIDGYGLLDKLLYFDILSYASDGLMVKVDRMTMANGLRAFSPFHDRDLIEFVATLPTHYKINGYVRKYIMRESLRPMLPAHTLNKKKKGFDMPIEDWLIKRYPDYVREILFDEKTLNRGYFKKTFLKKMVNRFLGGQSDYASGSAATIISLLTLELWLRAFVDK